LCLALRASVPPSRRDCAFRELGQDAPRKIRKDTLYGRSGTSSPA
jgi:hypothetical protein